MTRFCFVTLFPEFFEGPMSVSIVGRAVESGALGWDTVNPRDLARDRHRSVDDTPYGGGAGMLMKPTVMADAVTAARVLTPNAPVILMSPQGAPFTQSHAAHLAAGEGAIFVCGRYEGVDERFVERYVDYEVSLGDFVLSGGEPAAFAVADAVVRLLPGAVGNAESVVDESFSAPRLEQPQFTRPKRFEGLTVPEVLTSGDHARVHAWREAASMLRTQARRPDLAAKPGAQKDLPRAARGLEVPEWCVRPRHLPPADGGFIRGDEDAGTPRNPAEIES